jgi:hypothetical protein
LGDEAGGAVRVLGLPEFGLCVAEAPKLVSPAWDGGPGSRAAHGVYELLRSGLEHRSIAVLLQVWLLFNPSVSRALERDSPVSYACKPSMP